MRVKRVKKNSGAHKNALTLHREQLKGAGRRNTLFKAFSKVEKDLTKRVHWEACINYSYTSF